MNNNFNYIKSNKQQKILEKEIELIKKSNLQFEDENFAYEGIFDKKKTMMNPSTKYFPGFNNSRVIEDDKKSNNVTNHSLSRDYNDNLNFGNKMASVGHRGKPPNFVNKSTKSRSMANIFSINNRFMDNESLKRKNSNKSGASNQNRKTSRKLHRRMSEHGTFNPKSNRTDKQESTNTLKIPEYSSAFPNSNKHSTFCKGGMQHKDTLGNKSDRPLDKSSQSSPNFKINEGHIKDLSNYSSSSYKNPLYPDASTREEANSFGRSESLAEVERSNYKILSRGNTKEHKGTPEPILVVNSEEVYNKNDYINISETENDSPKDDPSHLAIITKYEDELGIINEESLGKSYSYLSKKPDIEKKEAAKKEASSRKVTIDKQTTQNLLAPGRMPYEKRAMKKAQTKMNSDIEVLEMYSDLSHLSSKRYSYKDKNDSFTKMEAKDSLTNNKSKTAKMLKSTIRQNSKVDPKNDGQIGATNKASRDSKEEHKQSISSISIHSSINIDSDEIRKPIKRVKTNMIQVNNLSDYKFFKKTSTKKNPGEKGALPISSSNPEYNPKKSQFSRTQKVEIKSKPKPKIIKEETKEVRLLD